MYHCSICEKVIEGKLLRTYDAAGIATFACSKACADKYDMTLREQGDIMPKWEAMTIATSTIDVRLARLDHFSVKTKDGQRIISLAINVGGDVSADDLSAFCGEMVELRLQNSELVPEKAEKKTSKKAALKEAQAEAVS